MAHLEQFKKFAKINSIDMMLSMQEDLQSLLEDYIIELRHTTNPNSIPSKFQGIKHFCIMNRIRLDWNIIYKMFPPKQKTQSLRSYTTKEIKDLLCCVKNARDQAVIYFLASTGARIGIFDHELLLKHVKKMQYDCMAVLVYAGHVEEYWVFLTPQASKALDRYHDIRKLNGEVFNDDTPIFTSTGNNVSQQLGWNGVRSMIYRTVSKSTITRNKQGNRYDVQVDHGFRKRFNTILKLDNTVNYNIAEKLMGHKNGLDGVYFTPTLEEMFTEFRKVIHKIEV